MTEDTIRMIFDMSDERIRKMPDARQFRGIVLY